MNTQSQKQQSQTPSKSSIPISKCEDLILETFIRIVCDGDHSRLGEGDTAAAWDAIRAEYEALEGNTGYVTLVRLERDIIFLKAKIQIVSTIADQMSKYYAPSFADVLRKYGISYQWENIAEEQYFKQLNSVLARTKAWYVQRQALVREAERLVGTSETKKPVDRPYFEDWLIALSKEQGYHIKSTEISTYQFAIMKKKALEAQNKQPRKAG